MFYRITKNIRVSGGNTQSQIHALGETNIHRGCLDAEVTSDSACARYSSQTSGGNKSHKLA